MERKTQWLENCNSFHRVGKYKEAMACYDEVLKVDPYFTYTHRTTGILPFVTFLLVETRSREIEVTE